MSHTSPAPIRPSTASTPESHVGQAAPSVRTAQTASGDAAISAEPAYARSLTSPGPGCSSRRGSARRARALVRDGDRRAGQPARRRPPAGPGHGPYWYGFYWDYRQRTRSFYVGKQLPDGVELLVEQDPLNAVGDPKLSDD